VVVEDSEGKISTRLGEPLVQRLGRCPLLKQYFGPREGTLDVGMLRHLKLPKSSMARMESWKDGLEL